MNRVSACKETELLCPLLLCEDIARRWPFRKQEQAFSRYEICQHLDLRLPHLQDCQKYMSVVYKPPHLYSVIAAQTDGSIVYLNFKVGHKMLDA